ncbi:A-kinase anchor protein 10, mitochondrial [Ixodes scapularis]|uniref:A-kinase anchor protein 10, mitochondrial n=1 Tax=Ixodes scapularis TaxID=6945 RepID=UPI001C38BDBC|nr:A-kinase anchor protein 10, mitochondrial [Ixodes scapularis]
MPLFRRKPDKPNEVKSDGDPTAQQRNSLAASTAQNGFLQQEASVVPVAPLPLPPPELLAAEQEYDPNLCMRTKSRLSKTLEEVLSDNGALAYLIQFAEEHGTKPLVTFWMEAESFRSSCLLRSPPCLRRSPSPNRRPDKFLRQARAHKGGTPTHDDGRCGATEEKSSGDCRLVDSLPGTRVPAVGAELDGGEALAEAGLAEGGAGGLLSCGATDGASTVSPATEGDASLSKVARRADGCAVAENGTDIRLPAMRRNSLSQDALHIFNKYIAQNAPLPIGVSEELRSRISDSISHDHVEPDCFLPAQEFVVSQMQKDVFPIFLRSSYNCKHQVDVLTSGNVSLADILYNDSALFYFMEYMEQEQSRHLVDFLLMADNFRNHLLAEGHYDGQQAQEDAMVIYDKYFSLQATTSLGFSDAVRLEVEMNICQEEGPLPSCFEKPVMILMQHLEKNHLKQFLSSQLYVKYISECIVTIQTANSDTDCMRRKKRSGSDSSSSDLSLASQTTNTLLAMDGKQPGTPVSGARRILRNIEGSDMKIDTGQFNPDSLWKRSLAGKLQMAHVNHLGKVTTEFEPEPDRKSGSNLTKAFKKLVNWDVDKTEEDLAWQVAEMIVKDICNVTLCPGPASEDKG